MPSIYLNHVKVAEESGGVVSLPNTVQFNNLKIGGTEVINSNRQIQNITGIDFSPSSGTGTPSSNLLDDYEEGTWTPVLKLGSTVVTQSSPVARYTKIGRQVTVFLETYTTNLNSGSGIFKISGLPFNNITGMRAAQSQFYFQFMSSSFPTGAKQTYIESNGAADIGVGYFTGSSGTSVNLNESHFTTSSYVYANMTYFTN